jgi:hypothetical protein
MEDGTNLFKIVDSEAGKTIGFYDSQEAARSAAVRLRHDHASLHDSLVLVTMDEKGVPTKFEALRGHRTGHMVSSLVHAVTALRPLRRAVG